MDQSKSPGHQTGEFGDAYQEVELPYPEESRDRLAGEHTLAIAQALNQRAGKLLKLYDLQAHQPKPSQRIERWDYHFDDEQGRKVSIRALEFSRHDRKQDNTSIPDGYRAIRHTTIYFEWLGGGPGEPNAEPEAVSSIAILKSFNLQVRKGVQDAAAQPYWSLEGKQFLERLVPFSLENHPSINDIGELAVGECQHVADTKPPEFIADRMQEALDELEQLLDVKPPATD